MQTIVEKILSRASGAAAVKAGDYLTCSVDLAMVHDSSGPRRLAPKLAASA
jgi:3-isopropylmalate/(R)-2-methylmalate dehydratase large subunit